MDKKIKKLTRICTNTKNVFTRMERFVDSYAADPKPEQLELRFKLINENWGKYNNVQEQLEELGLDSKDQQQRDEMEERYCYLTGLIQSKVKVPELSGSPELNVTTEPSVKVKLPQLSIPKFSGNLQDWVTFTDTFLSLVGDSITIRNIQKFHYLLSAINGDAKRVIQYIPVSEQGFRFAWEILVERYENEWLIINTHIDNIMKLPSLTSDNASQLRQIVDTTKCDLEALKAMKQNTDSWDMIIIYVVIQKLDNKTKKEWELHISNKELPTLQQLYIFLENRCNALESVSTKPKTNEQREAIDWKMSHSYVSVKLIYEVRKGSHTLSQCNIFKRLSNNEKYKIVRDNKLCISCLSNKHMLKDCQSHGYKICGKWHHTLIHRNRDPSREHTTGSQNLSQQQENVQGMYHTFKESPETCVLLATAQIKVKNCKGNSHTCLALLDRGSQSNFITESSVRSLGLEQTRNQVPVTDINNATSVTNYNLNIEITSEE